MKNRITSLFPFLTLSSLLFPFLTLFAVLSANAQVPSYVPTNGLVGYWPFNGNANDESGNGNNGTVIGGVTSSLDRNGDLNSAYSFDGTTGYIDVTSLNNLPYTPITYSGWLLVGEYIPSSPGWQAKSIIGRNTGFVIECGEICMAKASDYWGGAYDNTLFMWRGGGTGAAIPSSNVVPEQGVWMHFVYTQEMGGNYTWFINGVQTTNGNFTEVQNYYEFFRIGADNNTTGSSLFWDGSLDDIGIWNRALSADEVLALYNGCNIAPLAVSGNVTPTQFTQETYTYTNTAGSTYNWTVTNGVIISGQGTNSIDVMWANTGIGQISVSETNATNCTGDVVTYDVVVIPTNVEELSSQLILYPNPATTELNLQVTSELIGTDVFVFDALGKQILKQQILSTNTIINTSSFAAGNYVLKVGGGVKKFEVVK